MLPALLIRFRPTGPWRFGPDSGARDRVDSICHSDTVYSAVTSMMARLGVLEEWLAATTAAPAVRFSSLFPYHGETLFVPPPRVLWPPATSSRVRWGGAEFVPLGMVEALLQGKTLDEDRWLLDGASRCLVPVGGKYRGAGPLRIGLRSGAAVDREDGAGVAPHATACIEFSEEAGMWGLAAFDNDAIREQWGRKLRSALRLLADSGIGGERSRGWGRSSMPGIREGRLSELLFRGRGKNGAELELAPESGNAHWLLSLFSPSDADSVDWGRGHYTLVNRTGRIESPERSGDLKQMLRMVAEGSVLIAPTPPQGAARNVAPEGFPHPVYRAGYALSVAIQWGKPVAAPPPAKPEPEPEVVAEEPEAVVETQTEAAVEPQTETAPEPVPEVVAEEPEAAPEPAPETVAEETAPASEETPEKTDPGTEATQ
jgi:CRISPR/Cas system CSM-associated protein Csm4 (group 5 of RAMP superfamily)